MMKPNDQKTKAHSAHAWLKDIDEAINSAKRCKASKAHVQSLQLKAQFAGLMDRENSTPAAQYARYQIGKEIAEAMAAALREKDATALIRCIELLGEISGLVGAGYALRG